ncbi:DNA endonuclease RBBP8 [Thalassophryne amazonica]|uniref:DNA endonuclease RBBP8 n=1 Tax=Thalassophryne amazonica TaxID=390379 RepID=UPI00147238B7|nr:DNA endonuclease RBBP8 [Thalassophryne amazonica]
MSSPRLSNMTTKPADVFENLCKQLRDCHQNTVQELEAKVSKLKKERCLDAQRLELFYHRNLQLKDQVKVLQETVSLLEEKLGAGVCDRCALLEYSLKNKQDQKLHIVNRLKNERSSLEEENQKVLAELHKLSHGLEAQQTSFLEQEDCIIPDSPVLTSSLPTTSRLKKRKNIDRLKNVRFVETPLQQCRSSLFDGVIREPFDATNRSGKAEVLVPNTCEMDTTQTSNDTNHNVEGEIAETCGLDLPDNQCLETKMTAHQKNGRKADKISSVRLKPYPTSTSPTLIHSPDSTTKKSLPLLLGIKRVSGGSAFHKAKRTKQESDPEVRDESNYSVQGEAEKQKEDSVQNLKKQPAQLKIESSQSKTSSQSSARSCLSPAFEKNKQKVGEGNEEGAERNSLRDVSLCQLDAEDAVLKHRVETMWSVDPAAALSMYENQSCTAEEEKETQHCLRETVDTDCTFISNSLFQRQERRHSTSGWCEEKNDTLDQMFDVTAYGEYNSHLDHSPSCAGDNDEEEDEEQVPSANIPSQSQEHKRRNPTFAHVAVIRKKEERRKLKGTTCKECETYYANLPEEQKQKKLSACSRHRFLHIPPCTPENFWEVGFPSTQTCIERGYIKEQKSPQARLRRRQPFTALFSPKPQQES